MAVPDRVRAPGSQNLPYRTAHFRTGQPGEGCQGRERVPVKGYVRPIRRAEAKAFSRQQQADEHEQGTRGHTGTLGKHHGRKAEGKDAGPHESRVAYGREGDGSRAAFHLSRYLAFLHMFYFDYIPACLLIECRCCLRSLAS